MIFLIICYNIFNINKNNKYFLKYFEKRTQCIYFDSSNKANIYTQRQLSLVPFIYKIINSSIDHLASIISQFIN